MSKAENGQFSFTDEQMARVASFLEYPVRLFFEPGQLRDGASVCHYHRKRKTLPAKTLNRVNAMMFIRNINVRHILNGLEVFGQRQFHALDIEEFGTPEAVAKSLRTAWGVPDGPILDLIALIESASGIVVLSPFGHRKLFGMSCWPTQDHPFFYLNSEISMADLRWTIAHELGHLTMHGTPSANDIEEEADRFAAEFLMPGATIAPDLKGLTFHQLGPLKLHWRVSMKTLIRRADSLGVIPKEAVVRLYKQYSARGYNASEPYDVPAERPSLLAKAAQIHLTEHGYTQAQLREALCLSVDRDYAEVTGLRVGKGTLSLLSSG